MAEGGRLQVTLADEADVTGFRRAARRLLRDGAEPDRVHWQVATAASNDLFSNGFDFQAGDDFNVDANATNAREGKDANDANQNAAAATVNVPAFFVPLCEHAALHADPDRFALLYRLLWRLMREPGLRGDPLDPDRLQAEKMARMVRRDMHKMTAFVRFRPIADASSEASSQLTSDATSDPTSESASEPASDAAHDVPGPWHVAWFEPENHIVEATAPFFARRFAQMRWAILTPERCIRWDGTALAIGPGARREDAPPADAGEQLWLTYYEHIFNPARLKLAMMQKEMPRRYWHNLPEAALIQPLTALSAQRSGQMIEAGGSEPAHRRPAVSVALRIDRRDGQRGAASVDLRLADRPPVDSLTSLHRSTQHCRECPIGAMATQAVPGEGRVGARLMLVGEQPGDQEDLRGRPFVGPAGQLLDRALKRLGWPRDALYLTNAVKHFKYELRGARRIHKTAAQREAAACLHWLESEIDLVQPQALVALGATAARALLGRTVGVTSERGQWLSRPDGLPVLIALHPSALLRMEPAQREAAFDAWLADLSAAAGHVRPIE